MGIDWLIYAVIAAAVISVVAAGASAYMQYQQGQQQRKMAQYNAELQNQQAVRNQQIAKSRADDIRQRNRVLQAREEAVAGGSNLAAEPGTSPLEVMAYDAREGELQALRAEWSGDVNAEASYANARMAKFSGEQAAQASNYNAGTTLLAGFSSANRQVFTYGAMA